MIDFASAQQAPAPFLNTNHDAAAAASFRNNWRLSNLAPSSDNSASPAEQTVLEEGLWRLSLQQEGMDAATGPYPQRQGEPDCVYYMRTGVCGFGVNCRFNHPPNDKLTVASSRNKDDFPERVGQPECQYYLKTGTCKFGALCKFHHPCDKAALAGEQSELNFLGLPMRLGEKECAYYLRTGSCKYGLACKFHHPQPAAVGALMPLPGSPLYAAAGTPAAPVPAPYQTGFPSWPVARPPYISGPHVQGLSNYMPVIVSSPHAMTIPGWSTYQGPISPLPSSEGRQQAGFFYGTTQKEIDLATGTKPGTIFSFIGTGSTALQPQAEHSETQFPERPGQPDCHYYMKTGDCKFGGSCKFHHPRDRVTPTLPCALSVIGLPLRPGQALCTFYMKYGICKFGPTCKFDHPVIGMTYNSSVVSLLDMAVASYPRWSSPNTTLASKSSSEASREIFKPQDSAVQSEAQAAHDSEEVSSTATSPCTGAVAT